MKLASTPSKGISPTRKLNDTLLKGIKYNYRFTVRKKACQLVLIYSADDRLTQDKNKELKNCERKNKVTYKFFRSYNFPSDRGILPLRELLDISLQNRETC